MSKKEQVEKLISEGKTYKQIMEIMQVSRSTVVYYRCNQKEKGRLRVTKYREKQHPYGRKIEHFIDKKFNNKKDIKQSYKNRQLIQAKITKFHKNRKTGEYSKMSFTIKDVIEKFGENPKCYLTGDKIDIYQPDTYQFDHIIPASKGGENTLDNLGICTKDANISKSNHSLDEFLLLCEKILKNNGYNVNKLDD